MPLLCCREWPPDIAHLARLLARMPHLVVVDLSALGPDPTGSNRLQQIMQLLASRPLVVDVRLSNQCLPVLDVRARDSSFKKASLRVVLPPALAALAQLSTLKLRKKGHSHLKWHVESGMPPVTASMQCWQVY